MVDPATDFEIIPAGACPPAPRFEGRAGITKAGLLALEQRAMDARKDCRVKRAVLEERCEVCEAKLDASNKQLAAHDWAWRYGPILGVGGAAAALIIGVLVGWGLAK